MLDLDATAVDDSVFDLGARELRRGERGLRGSTRQVAESPRDAETLEILKEKARSRKTYAELAGALGLTEAALKKRVARFAESYGERRERANRERGLLLLLLLATGSVMVIYALMKWVWPPPFPPPPPVPGEPRPPTHPHPGWPLPWTKTAPQRHAPTRPPRREVRKRRAGSGPGVEGQWQARPSAAFDPANARFLWCVRSWFLSIVVRRAPRPSRDAAPAAWRGDAVPSEVRKFPP